MKNKILYFLSLVLCFACQEKEKPAIKATNWMCEQMLQDIANTQAEFDLKYQKEGFQNSHLNKLNGSKRVASWKKKYEQSKSKADLLQYADSVIHNLGKIVIPNSNLDNLNWDNANSDTANFHNWVIAELIKSRNKYLKSGADEDRLQMYFWVLKAEINYHYSNFFEVHPLVSEYFAFSADRFYASYFNTIINSRVIKAGEPVYFIVKLSPEGERMNGVVENFKAEPTGFYLKNLNTKAEIPLKPVKVGLAYIMHVTPAFKGEYIIKGYANLTNSVLGPVKPVGIKTPFSTSSIAITEPFTVK